MPHGGGKSLTWLQLGGVSLSKVTSISLILVVPVLLLSITSLPQLLHLSVGGGSLHSTLLVQKVVTSTIIQSFHSHSLFICKSKHNRQFESKITQSLTGQLASSLRWLGASLPSVAPTTAFREPDSRDDAVLRSGLRRRI